MIKKLLFVLALLFLFPTSAFAAEQFAESYNVRYEIQDNGDAVVSEQITIRNLTETFFGSNYLSSIPQLTVTDVSVRDTYRSLQSAVKEENGKTLITIQFPEQVIGKDKEYRWTLRYRLAGFVQQYGAVKQFSVPKITPIKNLEKYDVTIATPLSLGEPTRIMPAALKQKDVADNTEYSFDKTQIEQGGITSIFGSTQVYDFGQDFSISNSNLLPSVQSIFIPGTGLYQEVTIRDITPKPENVVVDSNGNSLAFFKLDRLETKKISLKGQVKLDLEKNSVNVPAADELAVLTEANNYWDSDSPQVMRALELAFDNNQNLSAMQKAQKIYEYVVSAIEFGDYGVVSKYQNKQSFSLNNSGSSILSDPKNRFCNDFVNVSIAMLRAAQIPAEQVVGVVYSNNDKTKPSCYLDKELHTWVRFLDTQKGWVYMDPSWGAAGNGLTFFDSTDLSHVAIGFLSSVNSNRAFAEKTVLAYAQDEFLPQYSLKTDIVAPNDMISGFPYTVTVRIFNNGNTIMPTGSFKISAINLVLKPKETGVAEDEYMFPAIPPFGFLDYSFTTKSALAWQSFNEELSVTVGNEKTVHHIAVNPIFSSKFFTVGVLGLTFLMLGLYILSLFLHYRSKTILESVEQAVEQIAKVIAPVVSAPIVKITESKTKSVVKAKLVKKQKFRKKKNTVS